TPSHRRSPRLTMTTPPASRHTRPDRALVNPHPASHKERSHACEPGPLPAFGASRRQRAGHLQSGRPRPATRPYPGCVHAVVTKLVLVRGSAAPPTEQLPVRTLAATVFVRPLITTVSSSPLAT